MALLVMSLHQEYDLPLEKKRHLTPKYPWSFLGEAPAETKRRLELHGRHVMTWFMSRRLFRGFISRESYKLIGFSANQSAPKIISQSLLSVCPQ
jgi:hypothetical protein